MRYAVIGAGIAGLTAALRIRQADSDASITVLEQSDRIGGKLRTRVLAGMSLDVGAESVLARRPEGLELIDEAGLSHRLVHPEPGPASLWTHGRRRSLPPTVHGVPADIAALESSGIIREPIPNRPAPLPEHDVSVADFISSRIGQPVVDRLVEPLLGGVYSGMANRLSLLAATPQIAQLAPDLLSSAAEQRTGSNEPAGPVFAGLRGGIGQLPQAVATASEADIRTGAVVRHIEAATNGYRLTVGTANRTEHADAVVIATPAPAATKLLAEVAPRASSALAHIDYASIAIITLILEDPLPGADSGFLVPAIDNRDIKAATVSSRKYAWIGDSGYTVVRASIGRMGEEQRLQATDAELVAAAITDLQDAYGAPLAPLATDVQRWGGAIPQYEVGHLDVVDDIETDIARISGVAVCGAAYRGVGIPAIAANASTAVQRLFADWG